MAGGDPKNVFTYNINIQAPHPSDTIGVTESFPRMQQRPSHLHWHLAATQATTRSYTQTGVKCLEQAKNQCILENFLDSRYRIPTQFTRRIMQR